MSTNTTLVTIRLLQAFPDAGHELDFLGCSTISEGPLLVAGGIDGAARNPR